MKIPEVRSPEHYAAVGKRLAGRPTSYTPEMGQKICAEMEEGFSLAAAAAAFDISRQTVYDWKDAHPEFKKIVEVAMVKRQRFLEERLYKSNAAPVVTSTIFALKNAGALDWREKQEVEHTGVLETNHTETQHIVIDTSKLDVQQLEALRQMALASPQKLIEG